MNVFRNPRKHNTASIRVLRDGFRILCNFTRAGPENEAVKIPETTARTFSGGIFVKRRVPARGEESCQAGYLPKKTVLDSIGKKLKRFAQNRLGAPPLALSVSFVN